MSCGCSSGHSCGCQSPFPWASTHKPAPHVSQTTKPGCQPGFQLLHAFRRGKRVTVCMPNGKRRVLLRGPNSGAGFVFGSLNVTGSPINGGSLPPVVTS